jgi:hypothetical protein
VEDVGGQSETWYSDPTMLADRKTAFAREREAWMQLRNGCPQQVKNVSTEPFQRRDHLARSRHGLPVSAPAEAGQTLFAMIRSAIEAPMFDLLKWLVEQLFSLVTGRRHVQVLVHRANFAATGRACYFVNVTNLSHERDVVITHVYFDTVPQVHALTNERPLPVRLKPDDPWETWVEAERLPANEETFTLARVRLSNGKVIRSKKNKQVPTAGVVPGGPISTPPE